MTGLVPYLKFDGRAREALTFYRDVFGGEIEIHTYADLGNEQGLPDGVAHGILTGPVALFASDVAGDEASFDTAGLMFALLGTADPATLEAWFAALAEGGTVSDPLQERPWGAHDGQATDRFGVPWLIGYED
ncbi:VOC family protein [Microbacterium sp.]|jgi:PhnB protein|uniref:VOC family protein n=1 Tax=Microbacterium sp. TaxID=51671 RepID=UPI0037C8458C